MTKKSGPNRLVAAVVAGLLVLEAPGPAAFNAWAGTVSGGAGGAPAVPETRSAALAGRGLPELEALAADPKVDPADRSLAIRALLLKGPEAMDALERVGAGSEDAGPEDYEVKREALRALKALGRKRSIIPVSDAHALLLLEQVKEKRLAALDFDGTLALGERISAEMGDLLSAPARGGKEVVVLTGRSDHPTTKYPSIQDGLSTLTPEQRSLIFAGADRGARVYAYDAAGEPRLVRSTKGWSKNERAVLEILGKQVGLAYGLSVGPNARTIDISDYYYSLYLKEGLPEASVVAAAAMLQGELSRLLQRKDYEVEPHQAKDGQPARLVVLKVRKSEGVLLMRRLGDEALRRLREVHRLVPRPLQRLARWWVMRREGAPVPAASVLLAGDEFMDPQRVDLDMPKGAPGALTLAMGGTADPDLDNAFVWPRQGPQGMSEILQAYAAKPAAKDDGEKMDGKAITGLTIQRTLSISAFIFTALIYPLIAIPVVGGAGFAALMAIGPLAAIATGPLNGRLAQKLTMRNGMVLSVVIRGLIVLLLPLFMHLHMVNFWTLALGSIANGWMLSAIMTLENAYLPGVGGRKNVTPLFAFMQVNYLVLQVVFKSLLGAGALVDLLLRAAPPGLWRPLAAVWGPKLPFLAASAVHLFLALPAVLLMIPNKHINFRDTGEAEAKKASVSWRAAWSTIKGAARAAWVAVKTKEAALLLVATTIFGLAQSTWFMNHFAGPLWLVWLGRLAHTPILVTAALINWIARSADAKAILSQKKLRNPLLLLSFGAAALVYSFQGVMLPLLAKVVAGPANQGYLFGRLEGAFFLGQLLTGASLTRLPSVRLPIVGRVSLTRALQVVVAGLGAVWLFHGLLPVAAIVAYAGHLGLVAAFLGVIGGGLGVIAAGSRVSRRGWIALLGAGLLGGITLMAGLNPTLLLLGALAIGFFWNAGNVALSGYYWERVGSQAGIASGVHGAMFNSALSLGFGALGLLAMQWAFPALFVPLLAAFSIVAVLFLIAPRLLPDLPGSIFQAKKEESQ